MWFAWFAWFAWIAFYPHPSKSIDDALLILHDS